MVSAGRVAIGKRCKAHLRGLAYESNRLVSRWWRTDYPDVAAGAIPVVDFVTSSDVVAVAIEANTRYGSVGRGGKIYIRYISTSICLSVCLSVCVSVCLSVHLFTCSSVCLLVCLSVCRSFCLSVCLSACLYACLSICSPVHLCLSVCLFICPPVHLSVCLSVCLSGLTIL